MSSDIHPNEHRLPAGSKVDLKKWPTLVDPGYDSKQDYQKILDARVAELSSLQRLLHASHRHAMLLIFQGMDASGKDGVIRNIMSGVDPQGCHVHSFIPPSAEERDHDFLWRTTRRLPGRGRIGIFNRSYYEEVLVVRVHPELLSNQGLPDDLLHDPKIWEGRFRSIVDFEDHLHRSGTRVLKFFLHLSKGEQRKRLLERIDDPDKNWKFSLADVEARKFWSKYMRAYEECMAATSTASAPWHIVPADDKKNARLIISAIVLEALKELDMAHPKATPKRRRELRAIRKRL